ncbi:hypothetical protein RRG08_050714 [Elysia crispata]|uniref:Uncharacterized protein n=1 Tax=Elysia crispata TaxID=231223 RepID=A0AAE1AAQ8_9GAST|nr:hypothetical protein RRG08_050714 [Elysia crispata]
MCRHSGPQISTDHTSTIFIAYIYKPRAKKLPFRRTGRDGVAGRGENNCRKLVDGCPREFTFLFYNYDYGPRCWILHFRVAEDTVEISAQPSLDSQYQAANFCVGKC